MDKSSSNGFLERILVFDARDFWFSVLPLILATASVLLIWPHDALRSAELLFTIGTAFWIFRVVVVTLRLPWGASK
jgi:hypothetical protein